MGELLLDEEEGAMMGMSWSVERRFRVTEVFLAVLWVCCVLACHFCLEREYAVVVCGCNFGLRDMIVEGMMLALVVNFGMDSGEVGDILKSS